MNHTLEEILAKLNPEQRMAATTIEGPVMLIAGPGSGKTEVLAARVAHILQATDSRPENILCLTFTDAASVAMRKRLLRFIGPDAYRVNIYTFHAFCNEIINQNLDYFGKRELSLVSELETVEFLESRIDTFRTGHVLYHPSGSYHEIPRIMHLFRVMKDENWSAEKINRAIDDYLSDLPNREEFTYKRAYKNFKAGDLKQGLISAERGKMEKLRAAVGEFPHYQAWLEAHKRYDYSDMIRWVLTAFQNDTDLRLRYQEQFLYVLVDEYQDTNGAQNEILEQLTSYWDEPNVCIVGDDDQSIYRFQGANLRNIMSFYAQHQKTVQRIILTRNYRSSQVILSAAESLIERNSERLVSEIPGLTKKLIAENPLVKDVSKKPRVIEYFNTAHEEAGVALSIIRLHSEGVEPSDIAVIYREHKQAMHMIRILEEAHIPLNVKESVNVLHLKPVTSLMLVLEYIAKEYEKTYSAEDILFHVLHLACFTCPIKEIAELSVKKKEKHLRDMIGEGTTSAIARTSVLLETWISDLQRVTLQELIQKILTEGGMLSPLKGNDHLWQIRVLTSFFNFVREESRKSPLLDLKNLLSMLRRMEEQGISLPLEKGTYAKEGVNFLTAHAAKGLEFDHVFIIGAVSTIWDAPRSGGGRGRFAFPDTLTLSTTGDDTQEARRLFYVAMTRAKRYLTVSYHRRNTSDKEVEPSRFVSELRETTYIDHDTISLSKEEMALHQQVLLTYHQAAPDNLIDHDLISEKLHEYRLSPTHLNRYLTCPYAFYFENILGVRPAGREYFSFGNAIHYALEKFFDEYKKSKILPPAAVAHEYFEKGMQRERAAFTTNQYERRLEYGNVILPKYLATFSESWRPDILVEHRVQKSQLGSIPLTGKIDKIEGIENPEEITVVDYKTGTLKKEALERPSEENPQGGNYWRQMVFYALLLENDPRMRWRVEKGAFDFIEPDEKGVCQREIIAITSDDREIVAAQIKDVYEKIMRHEFTNGCSESECMWCNFVIQERSI